MFRENHILSHGLKVQLNDNNLKSHILHTCRTRFWTIGELQIFVSKIDGVLYVVIRAVLTDLRLNLCGTRKQKSVKNVVRL